MADTSQALLRLSGPVSEYFVVENNIASTAFVKVFKALDKLKRQSVGLVILQMPIHPDHISSFTSRAVELAQVTEISSYGIDVNGTAFLVLPVLDGTMLSEGAVESREIERRYMAVVRCVSKLHERHLFCGDICVTSFLFNRFGSIQIFAGWGGLGQPAQAAGEVTDDWMECLAPEQRKGGEPNGTIDVFALGIIGYRLFTGKYPQFDESGNLIEKARGLNTSAPEWIDDVLERALSSSEAARFQTAAELVQAIVQWKESAAAREVLPVKIEAQFGVPASRAPSGAVAIELQALPGSVVDQQPPPVHSKRTAGMLLKGSLVSFLIVVGLWMGFKGTSFMHGKGKVSALDMRPGDISEELLNAQPGENIGEYIEQLATSGDPLAHDMLVRMFKESKSDEAALKVWDALLSRARRSGLVRTSDHVRAWGKIESVAAQRGARLAPLLRLLDPVLPIETRIELLESAKKIDSKFTFGLAASLALDLKQVDYFRPILVAAVAAAMAVDSESLRERSVGALMLATPEVSTLYAEDVLADRNLVPDGDLLWLLPELTQRQFPGVKRVTAQVLARELVSEVPAVYLEIMSRKASIPARVQSSLVGCALKNDGTVADVVSFAAWYDTDAEKALWALVLSTRDSEVGARAFDALAAKPLLAPGISVLYDHVRSTYYADRALVGRLVAALALENALPDSVFSRAFEGLDVLPKSRDLVRVVLKGPSTRAVREVIKRYGTHVERTQLLDLVSQSDPLVRAAAVEALSSANDVAILKILADAYAVETDPAVRAAYEMHISTIKERVKR